MSFVDIGGTVKEHMRPGHEVVWFDLQPHMYWQVEKVAAVRFGEDGESGAYVWSSQGTTYPAIFDSGTSMIMLPEAIYGNFMTKLFKHAASSVSYTIKKDMYITDCNPELFPTVFLLLNEHWVEISPSDYISRASQGTKISCFVDFIKSPMDMIILGDAFMRGFYVIHSDENNLVGVVPHAAS